MTYDLGRNFTKAKATNESTGTFASKIPTVTEPTGDGVHDLVGPGLLVPQRMLVIPYGLGSDDNAGQVRIYSWKKINDESQNNPTLWVPFCIAGLTVTFSTAVGIAGSPVLNTERFADTFGITSGFEPTITADTTREGSILLQSIGSNLIGFAIVPLYGAQKVEFTFRQTSGTPTMNALFALL